jgi:hypothetical protein
MPEPEVVFVEDVDQSLAVPPAMFINNATIFVTLEDGMAKVVFTESMANQPQAAVFRCSVSMPISAFERLGKMIGVTMDKFQAARANGNIIVPEGALKN